MDHQDATRMTRDPVCGMSGVMERPDQWFCSERCAEVFSRSNAHHLHPRRRYRDPWVWVPLSGLLLAIAGWWWHTLAPVSAMYLAYVNKVLGPLLAGLLLGGVLDHFVPHEYIVRLLSGPRKRVIVRSTLLGLLASTCSHGCLALSLELYRKGASVPAVVSFLLASPWASMSFTLLLLGLFGWIGFLFILGALGIAMATGMIFQYLERARLIETNPKTLSLEPSFSIWADLMARWRAYPWTLQQLRRDGEGIFAGMLPLGRMVLGWVQLGLMLSSVIGGFVPHHVFVHWLGPSLGGLVATLGAAAVIEVCSEGTAPLAFELYRHTGALGNAFAFLMGGVITDYTELAAVWTTVGRRTVLWMLLIVLPMVVAMGWILNIIVLRTGPMAG